MKRSYSIRYLLNCSNIFNFDMKAQIEHFRYLHFFFRCINTLKLNTYNAIHLLFFCFKLKTIKDSDGILKDLTYCQVCDV